MLDINGIRKNNRQKQAISDNPRPFLKWAGGKRQLLTQIDKYIPVQYGCYIEPFIGGGALFFYLLSKKSILMDINQVLINTYQVIKSNVEELIELLKQHKNEEEYYYKLRAVDRTDEFNQWSDVEKASRTIFLNRCCYNGLYRVNSKGYYNVPFGKYKNPKFCDEPNLRAVHQVLKNVDIFHSSFENVLKYAKQGDFIYFDPPYHPLTKTANFTSYTSNTFGEADQIKLRDVFKELIDRGCKVLLSNSYNEFILNLYEEFKIVLVSAKRAINSNASKRGAIKEVLVMNVD
jgi:DNA adenine methylase